MCLAVPGRVVEWFEQDSPFARAAVEFGGVRRVVNMAFVPEAGIGDYVLVHAGVAINCIDEEEAAKVFETLRELALIDEEMDAQLDQEIDAGSNANAATNTETSAGSDAGTDERSAEGGGEG